MNRHPLLLSVITAPLLAACHGPATDVPAATAASAPAESARPAEWGYEADLGPARWAELSPAYAACSAGHQQSPIDLSSSAPAAAAPWSLRYGKSALKIAHHEHVTDILDNGHTLQVTVEEGSSLTTAKNTYRLVQFHFHTPSEHTVDGKSFPMEIHFVHQAADGSFAVVSALYDEGAENPNLATLIANFPAARGDSKFVPETQLELSAHLPTSNAAHAYSGSFTTPPCTEGVEWLVLRDHVPASSAQIAAFAARLDHNNRPTQPLGERSVTTSAVAETVSP